MQKRKILNLIGLAQRAGKVVSGTDLAIQAIIHKEAQIIFIANDIAENTLTDIMLKVDKQPVVDTFSGEELSNAIGKPRKVLIIKDSGFKNALIKMLNN